jgi:hypothetical protein
VGRADVPNGRLSAGGAAPVLRVRVLEKCKLTEPGRDQRTGVFDATANTWV